MRNYLKQLPLFLLYNYPAKLNKYFRLKAQNRENKEKIRLNGFKSPSPMNELCEYINAWERTVLWDRSYVDTRCLILNKKYDLSDKEVFRRVKRLISEYTVRAKELYKLIDGTDRDREISSKIDVLTNLYKHKINEILDDKEEIANYVIKVSYSSVSMNKSFVWGAYSSYILKNLTENSPEKQHYEIMQVPDKTENSIDFLGKYYEERLVK